MFLALREMRRAKPRFALLIVAIGLLVFLVLFQQGLRDGLITRFIGALRSQSAPVLVYSDQARSNLEGSQILPEQLDAATAALEGIGVVGRLGEGTFTVSTPITRDEAQRTGAAADRLTDAVIFGYELDGAAAGVGAPTTLVEGRLPEGPGEAVASEWNRTSTGDVGFELGDVVLVEPAALALVVVGLASDLNYSVSPTLFTAWDTYVEARLVRNPDATEVRASALVAAPVDGASVDQVVAALEPISGVEVLTRQQAVDSSPGVASVSQSLNAVIGLLLLTALLVIGLFVLILTVQKSSALTLLRAIGASRTKLVAALSLQTFVVVLGGVVVGAILLALASPLTASVGASFDVGQVVTMGVLTVVLGQVAAGASAWRVLRLDPLDATTTQGVLR